MGPKISILEVNIEYNNPQEYFVTGFTVKKPILYNVISGMTTKNKDLLWKISDTYAYYINQQIIKQDVFKNKNGYYSVYKVIEKQSKTLLTYLVLKFDLSFKPIGYNNLGDLESFDTQFPYLPENLELDKFNVRNFDLNV